ncbi:PAS domain S-box protein [Geotalea sp. SG265]|uniref:SpoIIE family protein phosphatase n=1 Tax=Geotalea sp. SG265 TaxID=2922867 RepID=UPI001FAFE170|nr:PAS domain S-box protein [Geotalea sp. SG265]
MGRKILDDFLKRIGSKYRHKDEASQQSFALLQVVFDEAFQLMGLLKPDGTLIKINKTAHRSISGHESEVIGKPFWETPWWAHSSIEQERLRKAVGDAARGEFVRFETTHMTSDGQMIYVDFSLKPVKDHKGNVVLLVPEGRDISERRRAEQALRESAVKYRIVADNTYNWEFWLAPDGRFLYTSPSCFRISGHRAEEFIADAGLLIRIIHPDDRQIWLDHRHDVTKIKALSDVELRMVRPDGDTRWVHHICLPVYADNEEYLGVRGSFSDITNRRLAEEKNERLAGIVEASDDAVIGKTVDGIITSWNKGAAKIFGYAESEVRGQPVTMLVPPENAAQLLRVHDRVRQGEHIEHFEIVSRRKDGTLINMSVTYSPVRDSLGKVIAVSTIARDITDQKKSAAAMVENAMINRELDIAKQIQQSFLPACPSSLPGMLMTCCCIPAAQVGGDYYDFFVLDDSIVDAVIADVTGHSVGSSLLMSVTRSVLHAKVNLSRSPRDLLAAVNELLYDDLSRTELLISMFYVRIDNQRSTLAYANAGHNHPFLYRHRQREFLELDADGLVMGVRKTVIFDEKETVLEPGDILALYTDGIIEAENAQGDPFGTDRLRRVIETHCDLHPKEIMGALLQELKLFRRTDDVTMIVFKIA